MIEELTTYISKIKEQLPLLGLTEGLHILFEVESNSVNIVKGEIYKPQKGDESNYSKFIQEECLPKERYIDFINTHKAIRGKRGSRIRSATPLAIKFYKKEIDEEWKKWIPKKSKNELKGSIEAIDRRIKSLGNFKEDKKIEEKVGIINDKLKIIAPYLKKYVGKYFEGATKVCFPEHAKEQLGSLKVFQKYCIEHFDEILAMYLPDIVELNKKDVIIFLLKNYTIDKYEEAYSNYTKEYVFNTTAIDKTVIDKQEYGLSNFNNVASDKKPYLQHLTAPFVVNNRIPLKTALSINTFEKYFKAGFFKINPLPIFIDYPELNQEVVDVIRSEKNRISFHKIMRILFEQKKADLGNYYLFYFWRGVLKDLDFVSSFSLSLENVWLKQVIPNRKPENDNRIKNIFQFEIQILQPVFNNLLIQKRNDGSISFRYFNEIDNNPKYNTANTWNITMKYRKAFYDFIYKSRRQAVTSTMFHDIMRKSILDDIRHDEIKDNKHTKTNEIRTKLNIWFSLWNFFGQENKTNDLTMANKIEQFQEKLQSLVDSERDGHIQSDEEFAFVAGQVIFYLLDQSKSGNKTHALLEPFLQKTNQEEFKKAVANTFNAYKHEIYFGKGKFEKLCGEVMGYKVEGSLKELMPVILAGYFSESIIYQKSEQ